MYNEKEKLNLIKNGNKNVYDSVKSGNAAYRKALQEVGADTSKVDAWDKIVDGAYAYASDPYRKSRGGPRYLNVYVSAVIGEYRNKMKELKKALDDGVYQAQTIAKTKNDSLDEWLSSNGYSVDGSFAKKQKSAIQTELSGKIETLISDFDKKSSEAKKKYKINLAQAKMFSDRTKAKK